jgi:hypothetical protein
MDHIGEYAPAQPEDPWNEQLVHKNLACMWANFREVGAERLVLCRVLEVRSLLRHIEAAIPRADIAVVRLRAALPVLHERIHAREAGHDPAWFLEAATYLCERLDQTRVEDHLLDNVDRPTHEVAAEALRLIGWLR